MIQRIQTLFIFISSVITSVIIFSPLAFIVFPEENIAQLYSYGFKNLNNSNGLNDINPFLIIVLAVISSMLGLFTIFLYRKRKLQILLNIINIILLMIIPGMIVYYSSYFSINFNARVTYTITMIFPFISIILLFLAIKKIRKDEKLIRSVERIR